MKTYFLDIIPRLKRFSQKLDDLTKLTNQHWVVFDGVSNSKIVYIFRPNNELLISQNGRVEKAKWEYLGNNSLLIDKDKGSYLFKHGFLDENVVALKVDSKDEYALFVNESKYEGELNSIDKISDFLTKKYLEPNIKKSIKDTFGLPANKNPQIQNVYKSVWLYTDKGKLEIRTKSSTGYCHGDSVLIDGEPAPDGKYIDGWPSWMYYVIVKDGKLHEI